MGAIAYEEHYTVEDYRRWEGDWELIHGVAYAMAPSPMVSHQLVSTKIASILTQLTDACPACAAISEIDWEIAHDTVVRPDVLLICKPIDETINKTPEIIFEVSSPSTAKRDEILKFDLYAREGVTWYILVYPDKRIAKVYALNGEGRYIKQGDFDEETFAFELDKCRIDFDFGKIWRR